MHKNQNNDMTELPSKKNFRDDFKNGASFSTATSVVQKFILEEKC